MDYASAIERVYEHIENDNAGKAVMACLRLARHTRDYLNAAIFLRELYPDKTQFNRVFYEDTAKLNQEQQESLRKLSMEIWLAGRTNELVGDESDDEGERKNVFVFGAGQLDDEIGRLNGAIADLSLPSGMSPFDVAAFTDRFSRQRSLLRNYIQNVQTIRERIKVRCLNYAISLERQLEAQQKPELFLEQVQTEVNNYFKVKSEDVYLKLQKAAQLFDSADPEDHAALLTHVRRAMKAVADYFYPPTAEPAICEDGAERKVGDEQYLNRLHLFLTQQFPSGSATALLRAEVNVLMAFVRKLNDISSKGVHASVRGHEAKQGLVGLYMFLYNVVSRIQGVSEAEEPTITVQH